MDPAEYCRQIETYLCGKNAGHLVRIVGPAFEMVCGWAQQGVPLKVAFRGIDRYCERYYAKGQRRRPVRIEFCEADILDAFDDWRRAIGVVPAALGSGAEARGAEAAAGGQRDPRPRKPGLASHVDRVIARLTALRAAGRSPAFDEAVMTAVRGLDAIAPGARHARGDARAAIVDRLAALDGDLMRAAVRELGDAARDELRAEAERELASFGAHLAPDARARAVEAAFERLVRDVFGLPVVRLDWSPT
jgi:hypothetical protein